MQKRQNWGSTAAAAADGDGVVLKAHVMAAGADKCPPLSLN